MKKSFYIIFIFGVLTACKQNFEIVIKPFESSTLKTEVDTVLERNNPKSLDLSKHQLFIDTTRNSQYYEKLLNWKPTPMDNNAISYQLKEITKKHQPIKIDLNLIPKYWISLKKLNNEFVIYDPCDGITPALEITESSILFFYQLEAEVYLISKIKKITKNEISLELGTSLEKIASGKTELTIKPSKFDHVFVLNYGLEKWYVTQTEKVTEFDIVVNHCPKMKRLEFNGFDKD